LKSARLVLVGEQLETPSRRPLQAHGGLQQMDRMIVGCCKHDIQVRDRPDAESRRGFQAGAFA